MNLCGGITMAEPELLELDIQEEQFAMTSKRKSSSSTPSRRKNTGAPTSSSKPSSRSKATSNPNSPDFLNPLSRKQINKSRRQKSRSTSKGSSLLRKLDAGFGVALFENESSFRRVTLGLDSTRTYLRVRVGASNLDDNENDRSSSNMADIKVKVQDITRLEVGRGFTNGSSASTNKRVKSLTIVARKQSGDAKSYYYFEADTITERDTIASAIKALLEQSKYVSESRRRKNDASAANEGSRRERRSVDLDPRKTKLEPSAHRRTYGEKSSNTEVKDEISGKHPEQNNEKAGLDSDSSSHSSHEKVETRALAVSNTVNHVVAEAVLGVARKEWSVDDLLCGMSSTRNVVDEDYRKKERPKAGKDRAIEEVNQSFLYDNTGCPALGCQSQALAAVEDVDLANMANQVAAPWCTDDVCTASLKDFADTMKGVFEIKQNSRENMPDVEKQRMMAEDYITSVLGGPTTVTSMFSVKELWTVSETKPETNLPETKKQILNRVAKPGEQANHLNSLRKRMTFALANPIEDMPFVQIVHSHDDLERAGRFGKDASRVRTNSAGFLHTVDGNMGTQGTNEDSEDILYYDSDPEDTRPQRLKRGPRRVKAELDNNSGGSKQGRTESLSDINLDFLDSNRRVRRMDDELVSEIIETLKNERMTLMWHPTQTEDASNRAPVCVNVWVESGVYLTDGTFLLPKLTWIPNNEVGLPQRKINIAVEAPETLDLLDVCRVRECGGTVNRSLHPFAHADRSFIIQTQSGVYLFETQSKEERGRVVKGLRLVIARLASLLMLRDLRAVDEFFGGNTVPGEAPTWASAKTENDPAPGEGPGPVDFLSKTK